jgi:hypothetical protein
VSYVLGEITLFHVSYDAYDRKGVILVERVAPPGEAVAQRIRARPITLGKGVVHHADEVVPVGWTGGPSKLIKTFAGRASGLVAVEDRSD